MFSSNARNKIIKSWSGIGEVAIIKEVATKGEHIQLCIEYWAKKRKISESEYKLYFLDVVRSYVERLLTERLVCKAENVLRNVKCDVKCFYYQFACECEDAGLRETVLDHLRHKEGAAFEKEEQDLQFFWSIMQQLRDCTSLMVKYRQQLQRVSLETLINLDYSTQQQLFVELYMAKGDEKILNQLNKFFVWQYLVDTQQMAKLLRWCLLATVVSDALNALEQNFQKWSIETEMYEYALNNITQPNESLRNCFARHGYFFKDEQDNVQIKLRRLCTMECLQQYQHLVGNLGLAKFLLDHNYYSLMLLPIVGEHELEALSLENNDLLKFIINLKRYSLEERNGFQQISLATKTYLETVCISESEKPLVAFYEFLCHEPSVASLMSFMSSSALGQVHYLKTLILRSDKTSCTSSLPTPHQLLLKFRNINLKNFNKNGGDIACFSNAKLCQRYARKYKLNYTHYLKQQRSAYAVYHFLMEQLQLYAQITRTQLFNACETVTGMAIKHADNNEHVAHCVAFCEMLNFDTQYLRNYLLLKKLLPVTDSEVGYNGLIKRIDAMLALQLATEPNEFPLQKFQALMNLVSRNSTSCTFPELVLKHLASKNDWWHLLVLLQYFDLPLHQFKNLIKYFESHTIGEHLMRALNCELARRNRRIGCRIVRAQVDNTDKPITCIETVESLNSPNCLFTDSEFQSVSFRHVDLFDIILHSGSNIPEERIPTTVKFLEYMQSNTMSFTSCNLLKNCIKYQKPVLALLATIVGANNIDWCWLVWLTVQTEQWPTFLQNATKAGQDFVWPLIKNVVRQGQIAVLYCSFRIFYKNNPFVHLCGFLHDTQNALDFSSTSISKLRRFLLAWSNDTIELPLDPKGTCAQFMQHCISLLLTHLQYNFDCTINQQRFLNCICRSDISDICNQHDFCLLNEVFSIAATWMSHLSINLELLAQRDSKEYHRLLTSLIEAKAYDIAVNVATLLQFPVCDIIYSKWVADFDANILYEHKQYENEILKHALPPDILVNFFLYAASQVTDPCVRKYILLKSALDVIKQHHLFPNESFDRDQIEYDMILCYLLIPEKQDIKNIEIYRSEYFEQIMLNERCVLYKSFLELKELAGLEDLSICSSMVTLTEQMQNRLESLLNSLLDQGDIVEALRLQELFEYRPADLRFIVFCMALAEGVTTVFSMSNIERQLLSDVDKAAFSRFTKLTLNQTMQSKNSSSELTDSCSTLEFEEIPSKEKQQTLEIIQGIASKLKYGINLGKRVVLVYRAAMYLDKEYLDVLRTKDVSILLKSAAQEDCLHKLIVVSDILMSTHMTPKEIADLLACEITTCIVRPRFYIFNANQHQANNMFKNANLWGYNIDRDFHLFLELAPNTTILGNCLLEYCDALKHYRRYRDNKSYERTDAFERLTTIIARYGLPSTTSASASTSLNESPLPQVLSYKKQNIIYVELLIKAYQCFVHECSMEGLADVLHRTKLLNVLLTNAKSWALIVRMLIGIGRYREMFYCFATLIENEQFESLLGQFDDNEKTGLRQAILAYLREYNPKNSKELFRLAAVHFLMYKELAEMWEQEAQDVLLNIRPFMQINTTHLSDQNSIVGLTSALQHKSSISKLKCIPEVNALLQQALEYYTHATENYLLDNKLLSAQQSVSKAELVAMQLDLVGRAVNNSCACVLNISSRDELKELVNIELSVPQTLILQRAYSYDINWSEALLCQFVILQRQNYLQEYLSHQRITDGVIENVVKGYIAYGQTHNLNEKMEESMQNIVELIKSITLKYKLASLLGLKSIVMSLINDTTIYYLRDTNFGRNESHNMPDI